MDISMSAMRSSTIDISIDMTSVGDKVSIISATGASVGSVGTTGHKATSGASSAA